MEYVDLGLSVKWATCNVGANTPEEYGDYFAWGEIIPKNIYLQETYLPDKNFNKIFELPTKEEFKELIDKCIWTWTNDYNGTDVAGYKIVGPNGNYIFFPASGYRGGSYVDYVQNYGLYWSATESYNNYAYYLYFFLDVTSIYNYYRSYGLSVRLVKHTTIKP